MLFHLIKNELLTYKWSIAAIILIPIILTLTNDHPSLLDKLLSFSTVPWVVGVLLLLLTLNTTGKALSSRSFGFWQSIAISDTNYVLVKFLTPTLILNVLMVLIFPCYFFYQTDSLVPFLKIWVAANLYWGGMLAFILVFSSIFYKKSLLALALFCLATLSPFFSEVTPYFSRFFSEGVVWMLQQKLVSREITDKGFKEIYTWGYRYDLTWSDILHNPYCYAYVALGICFISIAITLRRRHRVQF